jgi:hypothetical protein
MKSEESILEMFVCMFINFLAVLNGRDEHKILVFETKVLSLYPLKDAVDSHLLLSRL